MPGCSFSVSGAIGDGRARGKVRGGGRADLWPPGGWKELETASRASKELIAAGCYKEDMTEDKVVRLV